MGKDGVGLGSDYVPSDVCCEKLERLPEIAMSSGTPLNSNRYRDLGMADVECERRHGVVDIRVMLVPELNAAADEGVAQVMDVLAMTASRDQPRSVRSFWKTY